MNVSADMTLERRRRLTHRALPAVALLAVAAVAIGFVASGRDSDAERVARSFAAAWQAESYAAMHRLLTPAARAAFSRERLTSAYGAAAATATTRSLEFGELAVDGDIARLTVTVETIAFGTVSGPVELTVVDGAVDWKPHLVFPGLAPGETLDRETTAPERAPLLAAGGEVLAEGPPETRSSPLAIASSIAGSLAAPTETAAREELYARGFPDDTPVGASGLERVFERELAGRPGGELLAGARVLARRAPRPGDPVRTTIDVGVQEAASVALAGRLGGVAALDPRSGEILALAGVAFSAPQPPGSTFKIVTTAAALETGKVEPSDEFPIETAATIDGVELANANGESCGGDFPHTFAHSCNSVFAPLGIEVGSERLVAEAEQFGWNEDPEIPGALPSTLPAATGIVSPLEIGSTAIGQFQTLATTLQMASVSQTIANRGVRMRPTLSPRSGRGGGIRVVPPAIARSIERMMVGVVDFGTGTLAQVEGVDVAGKTGTAELGDTRGDDPEAALRDGDPSNTNAWFTAFAPAGEPRVAVAVLLVRNGAGGTVAAPASQGVLVAGLKR